MELFNCSADWELFWTGASAVGTIVGSIITAIAVIVALCQAKKERRRQDDASRPDVFLDSISRVGAESDWRTSIGLANVGESAARNIEIEVIWDGSKEGSRSSLPFLTKGSQNRIGIGLPRENPTNATGRIILKYMGPLGAKYTRQYKTSVGQSGEDGPYAIITQYDRRADKVDYS